MTTSRGWLLAAAVCSTAFFVRADAPAPQPPVEVATLMDLQGLVQSRHSDKEPWMAAQEGQSLFPGDAVQTGAVASVHLRFASDGILELTSNTLIHVKASAHVTLLVNKGTVVGRVIPKPAGPIQMEFRTPSAVAGIRGTEFAVQTRTDQDSVVGVFNEGHVEVESLDAAGQESGDKVELAPGQETAAQTGLPPSPPHPLAVLIKYRENMAVLRTRLQSLQQERRTLLSDKQQQLRDALHRRPPNP